MDYRRKGRMKTIQEENTKTVQGVGRSEAALAANARDR